jgi:hypothetical protein
MTALESLPISREDPAPRAAYEIRVAGLVPIRDLLRELADAETAGHEVRTVLSGRFTDQAHLHGFLNRLRARGLEVVEVRRLPAVDVADPERP